MHYNHTDCLKVNTVCTILICSHAHSTIYTHYTARSPIYSHVSTTLQGLPIIRTFQKQTIAQKLLYQHQDTHTEVRATHRFYITIVYIHVCLCPSCLYGPITFCFFYMYCIQGWYAYLVTTRWFGMRIDLLSAGFLACVVFTSIPLASGT